MASRLRSVWQQIQQHRLLTTVIIVVLIALIAFAMAVWRFGWDWTGFTAGASQITTTSTSHGTTTAIVKPAGKTLWDWLQLLIVPLVLAIGGFWLNQIQKSREEKTTEQQAKTEREIAVDNQREAALQAYINKMSELLLHEKLRESELNDEVRKIVRVRTLTVLPRLDAKRKRSVLEFLHESGLIDKDKRIVDLYGADLGGADLGGANLEGADLVEAHLGGADLIEAHLEGADLRGTHLRKAYLEGAHLRGSNLSGAFMVEANLIEAHLSGADLSRADLSRAILGGADLGGADLREGRLWGAELWGAELIEVDLSGADLSRANLSRAKVTQEQLDEAELLKGATMPDGSIHP